MIKDDQVKSFNERGYLVIENLLPENILKDLSNVVASRPKFFKIINDAISQGYLIKEANKNDKRKFNICLIVYYA